MPAKGLVICVPTYAPKAQEKAFGAMLRGLQNFLTSPRRSSVALSVAGCRMVFRARRARRKRGQPPGPFVEFTYIYIRDDGGKISNASFAALPSVEKY